MRKRIASYLWGELDESDRVRLHGHLERCSRCARELESRQELLRLVDSATPEVAYPERFEELFPTMVRRGIEVSGAKPTGTSTVWAPIGLRQAAYVACALVLGILIGASTAMYGGLRSSHYKRLAQAAAQLETMRKAIETERVLDKLGGLKVELAAEGNSNLFAKISAFENVLVGLMPLDDEQRQAWLLARNADTEVAAGNFADATSTYNALLDRYPDSVIAPRARQMVAFIAKEKLGDYPQAIRQYEAELASSELKETTERTLFDLAGACFEAGEYENAAAAYASLVERFPDGPHIVEAMLKLSDIYFAKLGDFNAARNVYYQLASNYADAVNKVGAQSLVQTQLAMLDDSARYGFKPISLFLEARAKDRGEAFASCERLIHMYPRTIVAKLALDEMAVTEWYGPEAAETASIASLSDEQRVEALRKVIARCRRNEVAAFAHMAIGDIFRDQLKNVKQARREYQTVLDSYPDSMRTFEAQSRINRLVLASATGEESRS